MRIKTKIKLIEKREINQYGTFQSAHYQDDKCYYPKFFVTNSKEFGKLEENKVYNATIYVKQAKDKEGNLINRSSLFLNFCSTPILHYRESSLGLFKLKGVVEKVELLNDEIPVIRLTILPFVKDAQPIILWSYDETLGAEVGKVYDFSCRLFNKSHYDEEGKPSKEEGELLDNGKNKFYTEIRIDRVTESV